jgi:predicted nucleic acid-binding protein
VNVVDSSAWLEYFGDGPNAGDFAAAIEDPEQLAVPTLTLFEVFKRSHQLKGEATALEAIAVMLQGRVVELSASLAIDAAKLSLETGLPLADSIILATAQVEDAVLWTQDAHFQGLEGVEYRVKQKTGV